MVFGMGQWGKSYLQVVGCTCMIESLQLRLSCGNFKGVFWIVGGNHRV